MEESEYESLGVMSDIGKSHSRGDVVQQIKDLYHRKGVKPEGVTHVPLVPTKAALFGLDMRFRQIEEKITYKK